MESTNNSLIDLGNQLTRVIVPTIIFIGIISNSLNIIVLTRPALYKHACSRYFLANASGNILYLILVLPYRLLVEQYQIDLIKHSLIACKIYMYIGNLVIMLAPSFIVLASIDRWCASSISVRRRSSSNVKTARWRIFIMIIIFALFFINSIVLADVRNTDPFGCSVRPDTLYKQIYLYIQVAMVSFIIPLSMALFGIMTIYNIKRAPVLPIAISRHRRNGRQLSYMLVLQVSCHIILNLPSSIMYLIFALPNNTKNTSQFFLATILCMLPFHVTYITACFLYFLSSHIYRKELLRLKRRIFGHHRDNQVRPVFNINTLPTIAN